MNRLELSHIGVIIFILFITFLGFASMKVIRGGNITDIFGGKLKNIIKLKRQRNSLKGKEHKSRKKKDKRAEKKEKVYDDLPVSYEELMKIPKHIRREEESEKKETKEKTAKKRLPGKNLPEEMLPEYEELMKIPRYIRREEMSDRKETAAKEKVSGKETQEQALGKKRMEVKMASYKMPIHTVRNTKKEDKKEENRREAISREGDRKAESQEKTDSRTEVLEKLRIIENYEKIKMNKAAGKTKQKKLLLVSVFLVCIFVFLGSSYKMLSEMAEYKRSEAVYDEAASYVTMDVASKEEKKEASDSKNKKENQKNPVSNNGTEAGENISSDSLHDVEDNSDEVVLPKVDFAALKKKSPEVVAWIMSPDTVINYPVTQGTDNAFYLEHLYNGTPNKAGSIFMDVRNRKTMTNRNTIFYGHNMKDGSMFASIKEYTKEEYFKEHPILYLITPKRDFVIEIFSSFVANPMEVEAGISPWTLTFADNYAYENWLDTMMQRSAVKSDMKLSHSDKVVTLSTCTNNGNERFILMGRLKAYE